MSDAPIDVVQIMRDIRTRVASRRRQSCSDEQLDELVARRRDALLDAHEFNADFAAGLRAEPPRWNFRFGPITLFRSSRGLVGRLLEAIRLGLRPLQKLFWNPGPLVDALTRQAEINAYTMLALRDLTRELERLDFELQELRARAADAPPAGAPPPADAGD